MGDNQKARQVLSEVLAADPRNPRARQELAILDDPIRTNPSITPGHVADVDQVRRMLYTAKGYFDSGQFSKAYNAYEDVLAIDPSNASARRGMDNSQKALASTYKPR